MLEPEQEPNIIDDWSWSQSWSLKFEFRRHSPGSSIVEFSSNLGRDGILSAMHIQAYRQ